MQYRVDGQRIIAFDDQEPLVGEISFPKVPDTNDHVVVERVFCATNLPWTRNCS